MNQAFIQAVKLPTLLQIPQPNTSITQERDFNVEGKNSVTLKFNSSNRRDASKSRSSLIASVLGMTLCLFKIIFKILFYI
jgi:hypothetical protein